MRLPLISSAVLFTIDGPTYFTALQLVAVIFFAVALFIHQTKEVKQ